MDATQNPPTQVPLPSDWTDRLKYRWANMKLADTALQLAKDGRRQLITEYAVKAAYSLAGGEKPPAFPEELPEDMGVRVGDELHYHLAQGATPAAASSGLSTIGKLAVAASLLTGGAGAAVAASALLGGNDKATPAVALPDFNDTNSQYEFSIGWPPGAAPQ